MFRATRPACAEIAAFRAAQSTQPFTYAEVGMTRCDPPARFVRDHYRREIGRGEPTWTRARNAVRSGRMFALGWVELLTPDAPIEPGTPVAVLVRALGLWSLNAARIVYVIDEHDRFGFAYGTLPGHAECGEERFQVERRADGTVVYDLLAYSRPRHPLARFWYSWVRRLQRRFGLDSLAAMERAVSGEGEDVR